MKRNKPKFYRQTWHKVIRLGKTVKKKRKWRAAKGGDSKIRLQESGRARKPNSGWCADRSEKGKLNGLIPIRVENVAELNNIQKGQGVIVGRVGKRNRNAIIAKANEMKLTILNKYRTETK